MTNYRNLNIFEFFISVQTQYNELQKENFKINKETAVSLLNKWNTIFDNLKKNDETNFVFDSKLFSLIVKYLVESNDFFSNRVEEDKIDEFLLLAYCYEWICLDRVKDVSLLGDKNDVLNKLKSITSKNRSDYMHIFNNLDPNNLAPNGISLLKKRIRNSAEVCFNEIIFYCLNDSNYYQKIIKKVFVEKNFTNYNEVLKIWNNIFFIRTPSFNYIYSVDDSDKRIIYISVEKNNQKIAYFKFRIFYTYNEAIIDKNSFATGVSKELITVGFVEQRFSHQYGEMISHVLKIANRAIKNIFLIDLELKSHKHKSLNNQSILKTNKEVVKVIKISEGLDSKKELNNKITETLGKK